MAQIRHSDALRERVHGLMGRAREDLAAMVAIPSVADPRQVPPERCVEMAEWVRAAFEEAGVPDCRLLETPDGATAVLGERPGPPGSPTVLLYGHHDVQPPLGEDQWRSPVWELSERDGRWFGRGAADSKGNLAMHLTALRALGDELPVGLKVISEGAEEQGTGGLEAFVAEHPEALRADAIVVGDTGNFAVGMPTLTTSLRGLVNVVVRVRTLASDVHSGMYGGPAPDALAAVIAMLATLRDEHGTTTIRGLDASGTWDGVAYEPERFRADATVLEGVDLIGAGTPADLLWARPAVTVLGIDAPPVVGSAAAVPAHAAARVSLRIPPEVAPADAERLLVEHLRAAAPWHVRLEVESEAAAGGFRASTGGPAFAAMSEALGEAYGRPATTMGQGAAIPLCAVLQEVYPEAEILLIGVEEPRCLIHAPNESVDPGEIEHLALAEALFLRRYRRV